MKIPRNRREGKCKKRKVETETGVVWGEGVSSAGEEREKFLKSRPTPVAEGAGRQGTIKLLSGVEWMSRRLIGEVLAEAIEISRVTSSAETWEEWEEESSQPGVRQRSRKEEKWLWRVLDELDREDARRVAKEGRVQMKKIEKARQRMKVGQDQPSIVRMLNFKPKRVPEASSSMTGVAQLSGDDRGVQTVSGGHDDGLAPGVELEASNSMMGVAQFSRDIQVVQTVSRGHDDGLAPGVELETSKYGEMIVRQLSTCFPNQKCCSSWF